VEEQSRSAQGGGARRAQGGEKEPQVSLKTKEVCRSTEAEATVITLTSDEPLVIDVAECLDGCY